MFWYHWIALGSLGICLFCSSLHLIRLVRLGKPVDYSAPSGNVSTAIRYSFTGAMNPGKKETALLHLPTYFAGIFYHLGTFLSIVLFFLILIHVPVTGMMNHLISLLLLISVACGTGILIKRIVKRGLRDLSSPDDYISNLLVTIFQAMTACVLFMDQLHPVYFLLSSLLLLYFPLGKLKHAIYFFAARYHLGFFYGRRGTWPPAKMERGSEWNH
jgi:hypothetical protein